MQYADPMFKGWAKPGPISPGALGSGPEPEPGETLDAISGYFRLFQLADGHRFSTDDVLTAWYGTTACPAARTALDLGSGIGTVGMIAAWRLPGARFVTIEAQEESVRLARKSAAWNGLTGRYEIRQGDFRDPGILSEEEKFDLVLGSPPYFPPGSGPEGDHPQKIAIVRDGAAAAGLRIVRWRPVVLREGAKPLLGLFGMMKSEDLPATVQPWAELPLVIRTASGAVHPEYVAVKLSFGFPP